jgi:DNA repair protein RadC
VTAQCWLPIIFKPAEPDANTSPQGSGAKIMNNTLFTSDLAEIQISYSTKVKAADRKKITCSKDAANILREIYPGLEHREYFYILCLNRANQLLGFHQVSAGGISGTVTDVRLIFQVAIKSNTSGIILSHNHPSGNLTPSEADIKITKKIKDAGAFLDIQVLDHLIISEESYMSFADDNLMP